MHSLDRDWSEFMNENFLGQSVILSVEHIRSYRVMVTSICSISWEHVGLHELVFKNVLS